MVVMTAVTESGKLLGYDKLKTKQLEAISAFVICLQMDYHIALRSLYETVWTEVNLRLEYVLVFCYHKVPHFVVQLTFP